MSERMLSIKEIEERHILIRILERTLPSLTRTEASTVKRCILRMRNEIEDSDRRMQYGS